jgi:hypothetical protein
MRSRWGLVLRIRLAITAEPAGGGHALLKGREAAICPAVHSIVVIGAPRIILGLGAISNSDARDANCKYEQQEPHGRLLDGPRYINASSRYFIPCLGRQDAADRGQHRQAAGAVAERIARGQRAKAARI